MKPTYPLLVSADPLGSPARDGGRGLKLIDVGYFASLTRGSPARDGGRGLKHQVVNVLRGEHWDRPPEMAGAD